MKSRDNKVVFVIDLNKRILIYSLLGLSILIFFLVGTYISQTGSFFPYQPDESLSYKSQVSALINDPSLSRAELADEVAKVYKNEMEMVSEAKGQFGALGDAFGGLLNPVLSFISILVILYTVWQNRIALNHSATAIEQARDEARTTAELNQEMLRLAHEQYKESAEQTRLARAEQEKIVEVQKKQKFESTFASLSEQNISFAEIFARGDNPLVDKVFNTFENFSHSGDIEQLITEYEGATPELYRYILFIKSVAKYCYYNGAESIHYDILFGSIPNDILWASIIVATNDKFYIDEEYIKILGESGFLNKLVVYHTNFKVGFDKKITPLSNMVEEMENAGFGDTKPHSDLSDLKTGMRFYKSNLMKIFSKIDGRYYASNPHFKKLEAFSRS